jgi:hypothetical protein
MTRLALVAAVLACAVLVLGVSDPVSACGGSKAGVGKQVFSQQGKTFSFRCHAMASRCHKPTSAPAPAPTATAVPVEVKAPVVQAAAPTEVPAPVAPAAPVAGESAPAPGAPVTGIQTID